MNTLYSLTKLSIGLSWAFTLHDFITSCNGHLENVDSCADFPNVDTFHYIIYKKNITFSNHYQCNVIRKVFKYWEAVTFIVRDTSSSKS